jgi:16S rRNA processing protein RimM
LRVEVLTDRPAARFVEGARLFPEGTTDALTILEARPADPGWILRLREVPTREAAEALRLVYLEMDPGPGDALPRGAYYWHEMIGVAVRDPDGAELGAVRDIYRVGSTDILEVVGGPRGDFDLPLARPFVRILAPRRGEIVADPETLDLPAAGAVRPPAPPRPPRPRRATRRRPAVPMASRPDPGDDAAGDVPNAVGPGDPAPLPGGPPPLPGDPAPVSGDPSQPPEA